MENIKLKGFYIDEVHFGDIDEETEKLQLSDTLKLFKKKKNECLFEFKRNIDNFFNMYVIVLLQYESVSKDLNLKNFTDDELTAEAKTKLGKVVNVASSIISDVTGAALQMPIISPPCFTEMEIL